MTHTFHIPVLGLAFSIDSPQKVAQYGISSVISIVDDELIERMRKYYCELYHKIYSYISPKEPDYRANRITAYLDLVNEIVSQQIHTLKVADLDVDINIQKYFSLLPEESDVKKLYVQYLKTDDVDTKQQIANTLKQSIKAGSINVNIMSKVDKINYDPQGNDLEAIYSDASAALRGYAKSSLWSSVVLSAGMNPKLYSYIADLPQFLPNNKGYFKKKIILKVSDYRSALIQAKFLAKKGVWVSEFRIESGLNCGGHAFATDGYLMGPILEEFKLNRDNLTNELFPIYQKALSEKSVIIDEAPKIKVTAQGGVGTAQEQQFLLNYYNLDSIGWGSPFLLVPEATTVDDTTLKALSTADQDDFYISGSSPLGVPFNNFKKSSAEIYRQQRIQKGRPGAPCTKKYLVANAEFSKEPICTASRIYQYTKIKELDQQNIDAKEYSKQIDDITNKTCLCEGLATSAYLKYGILENKENDAVAICPGPNTAYFNSVYSLKEMVDHIYGRHNLLADTQRPSMFINELNLYIQHLEKYIQNTPISNKTIKYIEKFSNELTKGIHYYKEISDKLFNNKEELTKFLKSLETALSNIKKIHLPA